MADPIKTSYGPVYGTDAFGVPLQPHTPHDVAASSGVPVRVAPIPLTSPVAQWKVEPAPPAPYVKPPPDKQLHETRRQVFAGQMMAALVMHAGQNATEANLSRMAQSAVRAADLLLAELEK